MGGGGNVFKVSRDAWTTVTPRLMFIVAVYSLGNIFFGYDGASFGGVQAFAPFKRKFGDCNATTGKCALDTSLVSIMNSIAQAGKLIGTLIVGPMVERLGHRTAMFICCIIQLGGALLQVTSTTAAQFTVGRVLLYVAVGLVENIVPTYEAEITPAPLRGFFVGSLQLFLTFGSLIAGIVNNFCSKYTTDKGWQIATGMQMLPAGLILAGLYFTPHSPRWLLSRGRREEAVQVLHQIRTQRDIDAGLPESEVQSWVDAGKTTQQKGPWLDLFRGTNLRRTTIACSIMALQQLTGVTFSSSYGPTYFQRVGLGSQAFMIQAVNNAVSVVTALIGMVLFDVFGRRGVIYWGCLGQSLFLFLTGGLGSLSNATTTQSNTMVASFILYAAILHMSLGPGAYITAGEIGTSALREKTMAIATAINVVVGFAVVYSTPYLLRAISAKTAYIWGACAAVAAVWTWLCLPETKGRTLEELDQIFEARVPAWRAKSFVTTGDADLNGTGEVELSQTEASSSEEDKNQDQKMEATKG